MAAAIHQTYYNSVAHQYANGSQTAQSTALYFGFVPESERVAVLGDLVRQVEELGHLDVGILGAKHLLRALSEGGRTDLAYRLVTQKEIPGWGYWVNEGGATTLWEGWKKGASLNHIMFGDVSAWIYQWVAGIQQEPNSVGFDKILFRPNPVGGLTSMSASYAAPRGCITSKWTVEDKRLHLLLGVPCGSSARLILPSGTRLLEMTKANEQRTSQMNTEVQLSSGRHRIEALLS